jgi:DNA-binding response OmpR family regulator
MQDPRTVLIVEDEPLIAMSVEDLIRDMNFVPHTARSLDEALGVAQTSELRLAILDYSVVGGSTEPIAEILRERAIPFILSSGSAIPKGVETFSGAPCLMKPYADHMLRDAVLELTTE